MNNIIQQKAEIYAQEHKKKKLWYKIVSVMAAVAVFCTTYVLILPAITWEQLLLCEIPEHQHEDSCYETKTVPGEKKLVCPETEHVHGSECYTVSDNLICGLEESEDHIHSESCYEKICVCEIPEHTHTDSCYIESEPREEKVLVCQLEEHEHTASCFDAPPATVSSFITSEQVLVVAGSDFQDPATSYTSSDYAGNGNYDNQTDTITGILSKIKETYSDNYVSYGFLAGGDYCFDEVKSSTTKTTTGITAVSNAVADVFPDETVDMIFVQGNHDATGCGTASSGANDTDYYGAFVLNENDYRSYPLTTGKWQDTNQSESIAQALADSLDSYLAEKKAENYDKPVFILSHVPLHFSTRTQTKEDAIYADYFYDAISRYGDDLNIIFLFGHDHAWGDDDYLGGSSVFLTKGDKICIADHGSSSSFTECDLNFTYMNYGYTGYYWSKWASSSSQVKYSNADDTLTMTSFLIEDNDVTIARWDSEGMHVLKSEGKASQGNRGVYDLCSVNSATVQSPVTVYGPDHGGGTYVPTPGLDDVPDEPVVFDETAVQVRWNGISSVVSVH